jgi:hypothetical protein
MGARASSLKDVEAKIDAIIKMLKALEPGKPVSKKTTKK